MSSKLGTSGTAWSALMHIGPPGVLMTSNLVSNTEKFRPGQVCLTHEDLLIKWDNQDRQRKVQKPEQVDRQQETVPKEQTISLTPSALNKMIAAGVSQALRAMPGVAPAPAPATGKKTGSTGAGKKKGKATLYCNQFNKKAGCRGTPTNKGCLAPDGSKFRHGCSFENPDGSYCNSMDHNIHGHDD